MYSKGQIVTDTVTGSQLVVVEDRGSRVLVSGIKSLRADACLLDRAQRVLPAADLSPSWGAAVLAVGAL